MDMDMDTDMDTAMATVGNFSILVTFVRSLIQIHSSNQSQCSQARRFFNQWFRQSGLADAFRRLCEQVGVTQAWTTLQSLLSVPTTGRRKKRIYQL